MTLFECLRGRRTRAWRSLYRQRHSLWVQFRRHPRNPRPVCACVLVLPCSPCSALLAFHAGGLRLSPPTSLVPAVVVSYLLQPFVLS